MQDKMEHAQNDLHQLEDTVQHQVSVQVSTSICTHIEALCT